MAIKTSSKQKKFHLNIRKNFLTLRVGHWNRLLRGFMESSSLEIC